MFFNQKPPLLDFLTNNSPCATLKFLLLDVVGCGIVKIIRSSISLEKRCLLRYEFIKVHKICSAYFLFSFSSSFKLRYIIKFIIFFPLLKKKISFTNRRWCSFLVKNFLQMWWHNLWNCILWTLEMTQNIQKSKCKDNINDEPSCS